ncbi:DNA-methyltransferase [Cupriavidus pauculus]|uniref:DNA-methyltransferase n=1 Tax=Cupriavidus pauculus TaxID=82633 RepID=UPI00385755D3
MLTNHCHQGDCRDVMRDLIAAGVRVQCIVTSPPYWGLRDYGHPGQLGQEPTLREFLANMVEVFDLCRELLADDGVMFLNMGDSYASAGSRRAVPCDTDGKVPEGSPARDCLCGSLCDACRRAYQIGKSHIDRRHESTPALSPSLSSPGHMGFATGHPPTSDCGPEVGRTSDANLDPSRTQEIRPVGQCAARESTTHGSSPQHQGGCRQSAPSSGCLLCGRSLQHSAQASVRMEACTCDTSRRELACHRQGRDALDLASRDLTTPALKPKDLVGQPWRLAFALQDAGWWLRQDIVWHKPNPMPESVRDRCTKAHEYVFLMTRSDRYYFDTNAIKEPAIYGTTPTGVGFGHGYDRQPKPRVVPAGWDTSIGDGGHGAYHRDGAARGSKRNSFARETKYSSADHGQKAQHRAGREDVDYGETRNKRSVWTIATQSYSGAHFATFPEALVEPCVLAGSRPGDIVFDPFMGSGTVASVAQRLGRRWLGAELNPDYIALQAERTKQYGFALEKSA